VKALAHHVTTGARGAGVVEVIDGLIRGDLMEVRSANS